MTDAPTPDTGSSTAPTPRPKRPWTILGRLTKAVREQNWFAVVLELAIVVLGVVIGFQVTSWGQERTDRDREQEYLHQLVEELRETERLAGAVDSVMARHQYPAGDGLLRTMAASTRPPRDSVVTWLRALYAYAPVHPVLGTAEALIATGDLTLIRSDTLRTAITAYVDDARRFVESQDRLINKGGEGWVEMSKRFDFLEIDSSVSDSVRAARSSRALIPMLVPPADWRSPFPIDVEGLYADREAYQWIYVAAVSHDAIGRDRMALRETSAALRERVEAEVNR